jgi:hypothetical protein
MCRNGGATRTLALDGPLPIFHIRKFKPERVAQADDLLERHCDREIAAILDRDGWRSWERKVFNLKKDRLLTVAITLPYEALSFPVMDGRLEGADARRDLAGGAHAVGNRGRKA